MNFAVIYCTTFAQQLQNFGKKGRRSAVPPLKYPVRFTPPVTLQIYEFSPGSAILSGSIPACLQKASIKSSTTRDVWNPASRIRAKRRTVSGASRKVMFWRLNAGGSVGFPAPGRRPPDVIVVLSVFRIANITFFI